MGFLDVLTGRRKLAKPAPDRLFAISTAYVTLETSLEITSRGAAAIVFQSLATADFTVDRARHGGGRPGHRRRQRDDGRDLRGRVRLQLAGAARRELRRSGRRDQRGQRRARGRRLRRARPVRGVLLPGRAAARQIYWIYNYKRGAFYPFVPAAGDQQRDNERELVLKAQIG